MTPPCLVAAVSLGLLIALMDDSNSTGGFLMPSPVQASTDCSYLHEHASALQFLRSHALQPANGAHVWLLGTHQCC